VEQQAPQFLHRKRVDDGVGVNGWIEERIAPPDRFQAAPFAPATSTSG
jgi:hypothetical protein